MLSMLPPAMVPPAMGGTAAGAAGAVVVVVVMVTGTVVVVVAVPAAPLRVAEGRVEPGAPLRAAPPAPVPLMYAASSADRLILAPAASGLAWLPKVPPPEKRVRMGARGKAEVGKGVGARVGA